MPTPDYSPGWNERGNECHAKAFRGLKTAAGQYSFHAFIAPRQAKGASMKIVVAIFVSVASLAFNVLPGQRSAGDPEKSHELQVSIVIGPEIPEEDVRADMVLQSGHKADVTTLAFSPDGKTLASGSEDTTVCLWEPSSGRKIRFLAGHLSPVRCLAFSRDGRLLASGADDHIIRLWDVSSGRLIAALEGHDEPVIALNFSPDGKRLVSGGGFAGGEGDAGSVRVWDVIARRQARILGKRVFGLTAVFFDPDNSRVSAVNQEGDMEIRGATYTYDAESGALLKSRPGILRAVSADGDFYAIQRGQWSSQTIELFRQGVARQLGSFSGDIGLITFSRHGDWVAYLLQSDRKVVARRAVNEGATTAIQCDEDSAAVLALNPEGSLLATAAGMTIKLWTLPGGSLHKVIAPQLGVGGLAFSPDGKSLYSLAQAGEKDAIRVWDLATGTTVHSVGAGAGIGVAVSPDGSVLGVGGEKLGLWNLQSGVCVREVSCSSDVVTHPVFSPDGKSIAGNCRGVVTVWDVATGATRLQYGAYDLFNDETLAFSPDGCCLAGGRGPDGFGLCEWATGRPVRAFSIPGRVSAVAFTPDSRILALGTRAPFRPVRTPAGRGGIEFVPLDGQKAEIAAWEISTGRRLFSVPAGHWVSALAFRGDGSSLLAVSGNLNAPGTVCVYDAFTGRKTATIVEDVVADANAVFSPDRNWLAGSTSRYIGIVRLWRLGSRQP
jgi:WD40 repeat protein